jgi:predicted membrane protein
MKKQLIILALASLMITPTLGQEYKLARSSGKLVIKDVNHLTLEGTSGNEIVFVSLDGPQDKDSRATGLRAISNMGLEDNTGVGLAVVDKGTTYEVYQLKKMDGPRVKILVPKGVAISISHSSPYGEDIKLRNIESEIESSTVHSGIHLENVTGPMNIKTVHGEIEADFNAGIKSPVRLVSTHGPVDVTLPLAVKATMTLSTTYGEIFVDPALKLEVETKGEMVKYSSNSVNGKINGGGIEIELKSAHNSIYLRKK